MWIISSVVVFLLIAELSFIVNATAAPKAFGCRNSLIADEWRKAVLEFSNNKRRVLSKGEQPKQGGNLPKAKAMNELYWDCNLEEMARINTCENLVDADKGIAKANIATPVGLCNMTKETLDVLTTWWDQVKTNALNLEQSNADVKQFAVMAYSKADGFACSYSNCSRQTKLLCIYNQNGEPAGTELYKAADDDAEACNSCTADYQCVNWLCEKKAKYVPAVFPALPCPADEMTADMHSMALNMHDYYRRTLATGWAKGMTKYAPRAKAMPALEYDCDGLATQSKLKADCANSDYTAADAANSLNFHKFNGDFTITPQDALEQAITKWWSELDEIDLAEDTTYGAIKAKAAKFAIMASDQPTKIGCSVKNCVEGGYTVAICQYNKVLADDAKLYEVGSPCSACSAAQKCSELGGICVPA